jgi:P27 family predicted phage terminase small subunit
MPRGRKPDPPELRELKGNQQRRPMRKNVMRVVESALNAPDWMNGEQKIEWHYICSHAPVGVLGALDRGVLTAYVVASVIHRHASEKYSKTGLLLKTEAGPIANPCIGIITKQAALMKTLAAEMGFTPSSRSKISVSEDDKEKDDIETLLTRH